MPYELLLTKRVALTDADHYFNPCCIGGDQVLRRKRRIFPNQIVDSPELSQLVDGVRERLTGWAEQGPTIQLVAGDYNPMRAEG